MSLILIAGISATVFVVRKLKAFIDAHKQFRKWVLANHDSIHRLSDTFTVAWVTMQTLVLVVDNHDSVEGEEPPGLVNRQGLHHAPSLLQ